MSKKEAPEYEGMSPLGREAMDQGFNPRSLSEADYAIYVEANGGEDPTLSPGGEAE